MKTSRFESLPVAGDARADRKTDAEWPEKHDVLGVSVSSLDYRTLTDRVAQAAEAHIPVIVDFCPVDLIVQANRDVSLRQTLNSFDIVCPDGQPVRWYLNYFYKARLAERVCGTQGMMAVCEVAAARGIPIYLYGSTPHTLRLLETRLRSSIPTLSINGIESPPFRPLTPEEDAAVVRRMNESGAGLVFIGIGSPKQENFAWEHRTQIRPVSLCVGAAFDFIAGTKARAPQWMQKFGLEWLFRLCSEPRRLWRRYLVNNCRFVFSMMSQRWQARA
jgi:exopolysaccharide biosynthesis WecB/TagA/CpsF family protein